MNRIHQIAYWLGVIVLLNLGIDGIFGINFIDRAFVNFHFVHQLFQVSCLFAGALMMLQAPTQ